MSCNCNTTSKESMEQYKQQQAEYLREKALTWALEILKNASVQEKDDVVNIAKKFEEYIKNG